MTTTDRMQWLALWGVIIGAFTIAGWHVGGETLAQLVATGLGTVGAVMFVLAQGGKQNETLDRIDTAVNGELTKRIKAAVAEALTEHTDPNSP